MSFNKILGQDQAKRILQKALQNNSVSQAYLFYGQDSVGKKLTAVEFAKALNCGHSTPEDNCDNCTSCQKIERLSHPDFFLIEPGKPQSSGREPVIKIDAVRALQNKLAFLPYEGKTKVAIIDSAEQMNPQAANTFLKTLEEPPRETVIILIACNPFQLLPTIVSRCQGVKFHPLAARNIHRILEGEMGGSSASLGKREMEFRVVRSMGRVDRALEEDFSKADQFRTELVVLLEKLSFERMDLAFQWSRTWSKQPAILRELLDELSNLIRDLAILHAKGQNSEIFNKDILDRLKPIAAGKSMDSLTKMFDAILQTKTALSGNANIQLSLDTMLIKFCEAA